MLLSFCQNIIQRKTKDINNKQTSLTYRWGEKEKRENMKAIKENRNLSERTNFKKNKKNEKS